MTQEEPTLTKAGIRLREELDRWNRELADWRALRVKMYLAMFEPKDRHPETYELLDTE